jgi:hypothetical protein
MNSLFKQRIGRSGFFGNILPLWSEQTERNVRGERVLYVVGMCPLIGQVLASGHQGGTLLYPQYDVKHHLVDHLQGDKMHSGSQS